MKEIRLNDLPGLCCSFLVVNAGAGMADQEKGSWRAWKQPKRADLAEREEPGLLVSQQLTEANKFAYAALCGVTLAWLFPEPEQSSFREEFVRGLVKWLQLSDAVLPAMMAFANGLGGEGGETFAQMLLKDPILQDDSLIIIQDLVAFSLKDGSYDARARVLISHITLLLRIPSEELEILEETLLESLKEKKEEESEMAEAARKKKEKRKRLKRYLLIGLATVGGGTVIGLTGGLAAPLVAAGAATVIGSAGAAALGSVAGIAVMASLFGAAGAGLTGYKMKKRVGAIEEFEFLPLTEGRHLHITIAVTGWLCTGKYGSFAAPWTSMSRSREQYCLAWESKYLMELGNALVSLMNGLVNLVAQEALKYTVLSGIVTALTWPASLLTISNVIDNPWGVCLHRSAEVGKHLAQILLSRQQGRRPVTLIGFSLGARVIYFCLQEMAREKDCQGIIEDIVLLGAPVEGEAKHWEPFTKVVSGKIINGYCRGDWLLSFVYRTSSVQFNVAGLQPVNLNDRRMVNVDLSSVVSGHLDYMRQMDTILKAVGIQIKGSHQGDMGLSLSQSSQPKEEKLWEEEATTSSEKVNPSDLLSQDPNNDHQDSPGDGGPWPDSDGPPASSESNQAQSPTGSSSPPGPKSPPEPSPSAVPRTCSPFPLGRPKNDDENKEQTPSPGLN
ncbi:transmembrane and coiled-coil domain-containing protein 4 [Tachyglossus aculeatus]|uniref:transmembrane and coiled-coil domain-containing protein 4 n=1 Tax=Tachyglossus aculeatus TaxID=9261 RepID=UPI0018F4C9E1|nr:transmembrane and coiled-coil domain-containing protein 4 [Tachyglossus aculeatus]